MPVHSGPSTPAASSLTFVHHLRNNRTLAIQLAVAIVVVVVVGGIATLLFQHRSTEAGNQFAAAMETYDTPIATAEQPLPPGTKSFPSLEARAKAANEQFAQIADHYGMTTAGRNAQYLQGVTAMQMGQNSAAEALLKKSADDWNHDVATLAQMALAGLYRSTGRDAEAIALYNKVADKPSILVPAGLAKISLAEMYEASGKSAEAKKIYASIKDKDPKSASADIATQKLAGAPTAQ